jgi:hypothetical protein
VAVAVVETAAFESMVVGHRSAVDSAGAGAMVAVVAVSVCLP